MPLRCPRCDVPMSVVRATPHTRGAPVDVDLCDRCDGLWIDGPKLAAICPTVSDLPARRLEIALLGRQGGGIARCPRCAEVPYEFDVLDVPIDFCAGCTGVWFDGSEYGEIPFEGAKAADAPRGGPYRASAAEVLRTGEVTCSLCAAKAPLRSTYMAEEGLVCRVCHAARMQDAADQRTERAPPSVEIAGGIFHVYDVLYAYKAARGRRG